MDVIMSIKKDYCNLIKHRIKTYEFRPKLPKKIPINHIYVYETKPTSALKYILKVDKPIQYPLKIKNNNSYGVSIFNSGETKNKIAYPIISMYELKQPIYKNELLEQYNLVPPQSFVYIETYPNLKIKINNSNIVKIF